MHKMGGETGKEFAYVFAFIAFVFVFFYFRFEKNTALQSGMDGSALSGWLTLFLDPVLTTSTYIHNTF